MWRDISVYRRGETNRTPKTWVAHFGGIEVTVTNHSGNWFAQCAAISGGAIDLHTTDGDEAKRKAARLVHKFATGIINDVQWMV
jgi:hypothetical protein